MRIQKYDLVRVNTDQLKYLHQQYDEMLQNCVDLSHSCCNNNNAYTISLHSASATSQSVSTNHFVV